MGLRSQMAPWPARLRSRPCAPVLPESSPVRRVRKRTRPRACWRRLAAGRPDHHPDQPRAGRTSPDRDAWSGHSAGVLVGAAPCTGPHEPRVSPAAPRRSRYPTAPSDVAEFAPLLELQADLDAAADESGLPECRTAARLGRELLWQAAVALHEFHHPGEAAELGAQHHNLACTSVKACAAVMDLDERASITPAVDSDDEKGSQPAHDLHEIVDEVTRDLQIATDAHRHAADVLEGLDVEQPTDHPAADRTGKSDTHSEKGGRA